MKIFKILFFSLILCACASAQRQQGGGIARKYPVFLQEGRVMVAFKVQVKAPGVQTYNAVLTINKNTDTEYKIKLLADFATILIDADFKDGRFYYRQVFGNLMDAKTTGALEDIIRVLIVPPANYVNSFRDGGDFIVNFREGDFLHRFHFRNSEIYPHKMEQIKTIVRKKFLFLDYGVYDNLTLPGTIICEDGHNIVQVKLNLITVR